jgi:hypothetical protein
VIFYYIIIEKSVIARLAKLRSSRRRN